MFRHFTRYSALWRMPRSDATSTECLFHRVPARKTLREIYLTENLHPAEI